MELFYKVVFGFILAITLSSEVLSAPAPSKSTSGVEILITLGLEPRVVNATEEVCYSVNFVFYKITFHCFFIFLLFHLIHTYTSLYYTNHLHYKDPIC